MAVSNRHSGWRYDPGNDRLDYYYNGVRQGHVDATGLDISVGPLTVTGAITATTSIASTTTMTSGTQLTVTAGDARVTAGNVRLGVVSAFGTTEPVSAVVMKAGTAPAGAITTSGGIFTDGTTVKKIIADGTVSDVQT